MKARFVLSLLASLVLVTHCVESSVFARSVVYTNRMAPQEEALVGLYDLVSFLDENGLRTTALKETLPRLVLHEEGISSAGVLLEGADDGFTITATHTRYGNFLILVTDGKIHSILRKSAIDALVSRDFTTADNPDSPLAAAITELFHAFIFQSDCFHGNANKEEALVSALTEHVAAKIGVGSLFQGQYENEARQNQADLSLSVSEALTENPKWERCHAALGHLFVDVDFDLLPTGEPVPEGVEIEGQYKAKGVAFSIADTFLPPDRLITENASGEINRFYRGMSLSNVLTNRGFSPGPSGSLGCESDMKVNFLDPLSQRPKTVQSASLRWFAGVVSPVSTPLPVRLVAKDRRGRIVASDEFHLQELFFAPASFTLSVNSNKKNIASIETQGVTGNGICVAFDNLAFWPPIE